VLPSIQSSPSLKYQTVLSQSIHTFLPPPTTTPLSPLPSPNMHTPSDLRYPDSFTNSAFWAPPPPGSDSSHPAVTRDSDDRHGPPRLRPNQLSSAAAAFGLTQRDSYPTQSQTDCPGQYPYPPQHYISTVNYTAPPFDLAEYPVSNDIPRDLRAIHRPLFRSSLEVPPTTTDSIQPRPPPQWPVTSILLQIPPPFNPPPTKPRGTFLRTATTVYHSMANINKA
jgi:hypothetical protein